MRRVVCLVAFCAALGAYEHRIHFKAGASRVYRGYSSWVEIRHEWSQKEVSFTADPATDVITAPGHTYSSGDEVWLTSSGTLPGGLTNKLPFEVCDISGGTFKFADSYYGCTGGGGSHRVDITSTGTGTHRAGITMDNGPPPDPQWPVYLATLTGVPSGVTYEVWCEHVLCEAVTTPVTGWKSRNGNAYFLVYFTASKTATLGAASITANIYAYPYGGDPEPVETVSIPLTVVDLTPIPSERPSSYPAIPNVETWLSGWHSLSLKWCDPTTYATAASSIGALSSGVDSKVWFYDGAWTYRQLAQYFAEPQWHNCADYINDWYRGWVISQDGGVQGYNAFTAGLKSSCASCDMRNRYAITRMAVHQAGPSRTAGWPWDYNIRETAYYLETLISYEQVTGTRHEKLTRAAENLLAIFDELFRDGTWTIHYIYFDGIAFRALIDYFNMTGDQRIPVEIKNALDWLWTNAWNNTTKQFPYCMDPLGPRCVYDCYDDPTAWTFTELWGLVVPAWGWYYWYSGDDTYRAEGDEIFKVLPRWPQFTGTASNDHITIPAHGLSVDDRVNVQTLRGYTLPGGLASNRNYWVKSVVDANNFTLSYTKGGTTQDLTSDGVGYMGLKCTSTTCHGFYSGKMYNQQFRWALAYVQWRQGLTPYAP